MLITLIVVMVSRVYACLQIHQIVCIKYVLFFVYQSYLNTTVINKKETDLVDVRRWLEVWTLVLHESM